MLSRCVRIPMSSIFITIFRLRFVSLNRCGPDHAREHCWTGKVMELCYDRFGDFEGFAMRTETGEERRFHAHERNIEGSRFLSLGEGLPDSTGARDGTRADGVLDRGRRRLFSF